jgi:hypothetical protein
MEEPGEFFTPKQKQVLGFAFWAKSLAWLVLIVYILYTGGAYVQEMTSYAGIRGTGAQVPTFGKYLSENRPAAHSSSQDQSSHALPACDD